MFMERKIYVLKKIHTDPYNWTNMKYTEVSYDIIDFPMNVGRTIVEKYPTQIELKGMLIIELN
jgi:hypothetical protein